MLKNSKVMAIDISSLTKLITEFRQISAKDEITPESLGYLIQQVTDILANASTDAEIELANQTARFIRSLPYPLSGIAQGTADRNNILLSSTYNRYDMGAPTSTADNITIKQATTERAGAMRAQHVSDLYDCKSAIKELQSLASILQGNVSTLQNQAADFQTEVEDINDVIDNNTSKISLLQNHTTRLCKSRMDLFRCKLSSINCISPATPTLLPRVMCRTFSVAPSARTANSTLMVLSTSDRICTKVGT